MEWSIKDKYLLEYIYRMINEIKKIDRKDMNKYSIMKECKYNKDSIY